MYMLTGLGYGAAEAIDCGSALAYLTKHTADVVLTDIHMPGGDGLALIRTIREHHSPRPCIIAMSGSMGSSIPEDENSAHAAGADRVLMKPISRVRLDRTIRELLPGDPRLPPQGP
jgi:CheY-like chemotaxis protein